MARSVATPGGDTKPVRPFGLTRCAHEAVLIYSEPTHTGDSTRWARAPGMAPRSRHPSAWWPALTGRAGPDRSGHRPV